jgi:hypothetical protein
MLSEIFPEVDGGNDKLESLLRLTAASKQKHGSVLHVACCKPQPSPVQCAYYSSITPSAPRVGFGCTYDLLAVSVFLDYPVLIMPSPRNLDAGVFCTASKSQCFDPKKARGSPTQQIQQLPTHAFFCAACSSPVSANGLMRIHTSDIHLRMTRMSNTFAI